MLEIVDDEKFLNEDTSFTPLIEVKELPSGFKGYPEGTKISYAPLTLGELEALNSGTMDVLRGIAMLLKSIRCNTMPVEELYYWDVMYIGIQRKLLAFGDTRGILYNYCPKCGAEVEFEFEHTQLEFETLQAPDLPIITTIANHELEFGLITIRDFLEIDTDKGTLDVYARMIKNKSYEEAYEIVSNSSGKDTKKLKFIDKQLTYGLKPFEVICDNIITEPNPDYSPKKKGVTPTIKHECGEKVYMEVRTPFEVVFPENTDNLDIESEIQYGRK